MSRAVAAAVFGVALTLTACSGSSRALPNTGTPACPLLAQLAQTGQTVARADVADPEKFDATLKTAVADYVRIARRLEVVVPLRLRSDVAKLETAAQERRFTDATALRAGIDDYARSKCGSSASKASG
jgi:hypothetical protein